MAKTTSIEDAAPIESPFIGGEPATEDEINEMSYPREDHDPPVETHPPATKEEAALRAEQAEKDEEETRTVDDVVEKPKKDKVEKKAAEEEEEDSQEEENRIPYKRFKEVNDQLKEMREKVAQLEDAANKEPPPPPPPQPKAPEFDFDAKEEAYMDAVLEGDKETAKALRQEIRTAEIELAKFEAEQISKAGDELTVAQREFEETGKAIETEFPELAEGTESYNPAARQEAIDLYVGYAQSGKYTAAQALDKACRQVAKFYGFGAEESAPVDPVETIEPKKPDIKKKVEAQNKQPPKMQTRDSSTQEEPRVDIRNMSDEEYEALPESARRRLRGDYG